MELYPAIDLLEGRVVRLLRGDYDAVTVYHEDAVALAAEWRGVVRRLHLVDLEGARSGQDGQRPLVERVISAFGPGVQVGGGVRSLSAVSHLVRLGAERVVLGTAALKDPALLEAAALQHPGRVVVAVDARAGRVATDGWREQSDVTATDLVRRYAHLPLGAVLYTDIERDGTEVGPNVEATAALAHATGLPVIASGGVGTLAHLEALARTGVVAGAIVGRALHEGRFTLEAALEAAGG